MKTTTVVIYKDRWGVTRTLINPSAEHVKRLYSLGHCVTIEKLLDGVKIVKQFRY